ncbi:hypothetical protein Tco_1029290 [Tanacetum coccineum]|uniref:Retroviral polymerase SH3-like domain-containing protein n=1 Tax=Tanacetum coccineum TaxID=301880 RepID=A0ABQ5G3K1_9ASTR
MILYNALPCKEYERVFMCKIAKKVCHAFIITHQGNSQVKNCKIDLLTQEYEKFLISNEETIDSGFIRFNAIVTSLKSSDPNYSSNNHVYEMVLDNNGVASKTTKENVKSLALKAKVTREQTSDDSNSQGGSDEDVDEEEEAEEFNLMARNFRKFFRKGYSQTSKAYIVLNKETMRIEESLNVTFDESLPEPKSSSSVEDDRINEPIVQDLNGSSSLQVNVSDEGYHKSVKEAKGHLIEQVIEDDDDSMVVPQTPSEKIRTRIDNTRVTPPLIRGIREDKIWGKIRNPLSPNQNERGYFVCCENAVEMINSIKDLREENRDMFSSINEAIKLMLDVATNMSCVVENDIGKEGSKDNLKK